MKTTKNIARLTVTAGLTAALSFGGVMAPVTMAFAEDATTTTNSITIKKNAKNGDVRYKAYQIFEADVVDESDKTDKVVSNVKWATGVKEPTQNAIIEAINKYNKDEAADLKTDASAQDVADWLTKHITGTTKETVLKKDDLLNTLAGLVEKQVTPTTPTATANGSFAADTKVSFDKSGYYLFLTDAGTLASDESTTGSKNTATSPIYAVVGAGDVEVTEKTSIPTVNKQILDDTKDKTADNAETDDWKNVGDAWIGQVIDYRLTGTVADNITSYDKYQYEFQDTLSKGLDVVKDANGSPLNLKVYIVKKDGTHAEVKHDASKGYTATATKVKDSKTELLKVSFADLKAIEDTTNASIAAGDISNVVVTYQAKLTSDAEYTVTGNTNEVKLVYSNNPMTTDKGTSESDKVTDYVFGLDVTKTDADQNNTDAKLVAGFKVKMIKEGDKEVADGGQWLTADGGLTTDASKAGEFKTETNNEVFIPGLVKGTYEISETTTPSGYNTIAPFQITVNPAYNTAGKLSGLTVTDTSNMVDSNMTNENVTTTKIPITIKNKKGSGLPLTGLNGVTFTWIAGGAVLCIGVAHLIRGRKQAEESEQE